MPNQTVARDLARRKKIEAIRAEQRASRRRRITAIGSAVTVVIVVLALVLVKVTTGGTTKAPAAASSTASASVISQVTSVPQSVLDAVGKGSGVTAPTASSGAALTSAGKPEVLYVGAEYCPYCAAERWAVAQALSRFGTFSGLGETSSSSTDVYPSTATLSFHGATYTSQYLSFSGFEETTNQPDGKGGYTPLDTVPADVTKLVSANDSQGSIPFVDLGGKSIVTGSSYSPQVLAGLTQAQIAADLQNASSPVAKAVLGAANAITARLCDLTGNKPADVCTSAAVTAARAG
jgi:hypothetical protein